MSGADLPGVDPTAVWEVQKGEKHAPFTGQPTQLSAMQASQLYFPLVHEPNCHIINTTKCYSIIEGGCLQRMFRFAYNAADLLLADPKRLFLCCTHGPLLAV
jgi:hypothetical protein